MGLPFSCDHRLRLMGLGRPLTLSGALHTPPLGRSSHEWGQWEVKPLPDSSPSFRSADQML